MDADLQFEVRSSDGLCRSKKRAPDGVTVAESFYAKTQTLVGYTFSSLPFRWPPVGSQSCATVLTFA
jgi:hypothetical protein